MFASVARFDIRFRWLIVTIWIAGMVAAIRLLPSLQSVNTFNNVQVLPSSSLSVEASQLARPFQGNVTATAALNPMTAIIVASRSTGRLTAADNVAFGNVLSDARRIPGVQLVRNEGVNAAGTAREALVTVTPAAAKTEAIADNIVATIRASFSRAGSPTGLSFHLTGQFAAMVDASSAHAGNIAVLTVIFLVVLLFVVYRALLAPLLTLIPAVISMLIAQRLIAEAISAGLLSAAVLNLLIVLLLGAGADYGLFLAFRFREELTRTADTQEALVATMTRIGEVLSYSALTVALSLLALLLAPFDLYRSIGPSFAIGIVVLLAAALTLIPALLSIFGRSAFWPLRPRPGDRQPKLWGSVAARVVRRPVVTLVVGAALFGALAAGLVGYRAGGITNGPPAGSDSASGAKVLASRFPAASLGTDELILKFRTPVWDDPAPMVRAQDDLAAAHVFAAITGPLGSGRGNPLIATRLRSDPQASGYISPDGRSVLFYATLRPGAPGTTAAASAIPAARSTLDAVAAATGATDRGVAGQDAFDYDIGVVSNASDAIVVPVVLGLILILLILLLRSLVAPLYLALTVGLSYVASLGFAMIAFVHIGGNDGLLFVLPLLMFVFSMAVGEDYNILVMSRIREEAGGREPFRDALIQAIGVTGGTVTSAGLVLAGTFLVLGVAGGISNAQQLGFAIAFGVLMDTFFVRTLLVPSIAMLLGGMNWWPSALSRDVDHVAARPGHSPVTR